MNAEKLLALCLMLGATPALAADLATTVRDYDRARFGNDVATLDRLVAGDFVLVNSNVSLEDKAQYLADFNRPGFKVGPHLIEQPVHKMRRDGAVIGGLVNLRVDPRGQASEVPIASGLCLGEARWPMAAHVRAGDGYPLSVMEIENHASQ